MSKNLIIPGLLLILAGVGVWYFGTSDTTSPTENGTTENQTYTSTAHGFSFTYPKDWELSERSMTVQGVKLETVTLIPSDFEAPEGGEGPPSVTVIVGENTNGKALAEWLNQFQSAIGGPAFDFTEGTFVGLPSITYTSTGLYEADNIAIARGNNVYVISGSWMTRQDASLQVFNQVVESFRLLP